MSDPGIDTDSKRALLERLQLALELEWSTLPPYLVALLSMKPHKNREAAELIRGVALEEMLHFALVANVMNALGGRPRIDPARCPAYPLGMTFEGRPFADRSFPIDLAAFSKEAIATFMKIEQPERPAAELAGMIDRIDVPAPTIGEFYDGLVRLLEELDAALPGALFVGDPARQLEGDYFWAGGGRLTQVSDLSSAKAALDTVIEQGEGAWPWSREAFAQTAGRPLAMGHYYRFAEIFHERRYVDSDDPDGLPSGPALAIDYAAVYPIRTNAKACDYPAGSRAASLNDRFNRRYTMMLRQLGQSIDGEPKALYTAIMNGMHGMTSIARALMETRLDGGPSGETGCPTFEWLD